jgi:hypothetical protein
MYAHNKQELRSAPALTPKTKTKFCRNLKFGVCSHGSKCNFAHSPSELNLPTDPVMKLPPGLDWEGIFGDDDEDTSYVSNSADSGDDKSDQDSTPTPGNELGEPAYVQIGSAIDPAIIDPAIFCSQLAMDMESFTELPLKDADFYSLGDFTGVDPAIALTDFTGDWGIDPVASYVADYMNSAEFWNTDLSAYNEQLHGWDWQGFDQNVVIN